MGDRTYLSMTIAARDEEKFLAILGEDTLIGYFDELEDNGEELTLTINEANYGLFEERLEWAKEGLAFYGYHYEGSGYGAALFAAIDGLMEDVPGITGGGVMLVVEMNEDTGELFSGSLEAARRYVEVRKRVSKYIESASDVSDGEE